MTTGEMSAAERLQAIRQRADGSFSETTAAQSSVEINGFPLSEVLAAMESNAQAARRGDSVGITTLIAHAQCLVEDLPDEIARLADALHTAERERDEALAGHDDAILTQGAFLVSLRAAEEREAALREALRHYANEDHWTEEHNASPFTTWGYDGGEPLHEPCTSAGS